MSSEDLGLDATLADHVVTLLGAHGVQANHRDGVVYVGTGDARWVRLSATRETNPSVTRLDVEAAGPDGSRVVDSLNGFADPRPINACDKCGCARFRDRIIHDGQSTTRACERCGRFMGFPNWYGEELLTR